MILISHIELLILDLTLYTMQLGKFTIINLVLLFCLYRKCTFGKFTSLICTIILHIFYSYNIS